MSTEQNEMEQIVREVLRRLREREITNEVRAEPAATRDQPQVLELADRLVTLATLHGKLAGIEQVLTKPGTVITPSARDELKAKQIKLEFAVRPLDRNRPHRQLVLAATTNYNAGPLLRSLAAGGVGIRQFSESDWKEAVKKMTVELKNSPASGVMLTDRPAAAACLANRDCAIRAAVAADERSAKDAVESLDANLLVVDPAAHSLWALQNLLKEYSQSGHREMPL